MKENEVLSRFMGLKQDTYSKLWPNPTGLTYDRAPEPLYSKSYDWLMPVWYKFRDLHKGINTQVLLDIHKDYRKEIGNTILNSWDSSEGCAEACKLLAQAIEWYNANKQLTI